MASGQEERKFLEQETQELYEAVLGLGGKRDEESTKLVAEKVCNILYLMQTHGQELEVDEDQKVLADDIKQVLQEMLNEFRRLKGTLKPMLDKEPEGSDGENFPVEEYVQALISASEACRKAAESCSEVREKSKATQAVPSEANEYGLNSLEYVSTVTASSLLPLLACPSSLFESDAGAGSIVLDGKSMNFRFHQDALGKKGQLSANELLRESKALKIAMIFGEAVRRNPRITRNLAKIFLGCLDKVDVKGAVLVCALM